MSSNATSSDDQDIFNLNIDQLVSSLISPIDAIRSKTATDGFIESRVNAFYRMIGFPVANNSSEYFSPGYDVNLNTNFESIKKRDTIINSIVNNKDLIFKQLEPRELTYKYYSKVFSNGGFTAKAFALGSLFIRSFEKQFGDTAPLELDKTQIQSVSERSNQLQLFYSVNDELTASINELISSPNFLSNHILKPFIVDPRISILPDSSVIAAPFLKDASQIQAFSGGSYNRPYIERVISLRLDNKNATKNSINIEEIIDSIKENTDITDDFLIAVSNNPEKELLNSNLTIFNNYFKLLRAILNNLVENIKIVIDARHQINFQPVPDPNFGMEGNITLEQISDDDNNQEIEKNILSIYNKKSLQDFSFTPDNGIPGVADPGSFVFSGINDIVFSADKVIETSSQDMFNTLVSKRNAIANPALQSIKNIEYIMGEFSGLGLVDIVAIQSAFWLMDMDKLLGLIDQAAYDRLVENRSFANLTTASRTDDVLESLKDFETKLKDIYKLIQLYFDQIYSGKLFTS